MAKILIVEDHALSRQMLVTLLGHMGHRLFEAGDGLVALSIAQKEQPDLIICDIVMPGIDGMEFVRRLRAETALPRIPVIFYTAIYRLPEVIQLDEFNGNCRVIPKPSEPSYILQTVDEVLGVSSLKSVCRSRLAGGDNPGKPNFFQDAGLKLAMLMELSLSMVAVRNPVNLLSTFCRAVREIFNCTHALLAIQEEKEKTFYYLGEPEAAPSFVCSPELLPPGEMIRQVMGEGVPLRWRQPTFPSETVNGQEREEYTSWLIVPLTSPSRVYGWLCLSNKLTGLAFTDEDEEMVMALSKQVALAYENILLVEELQKSQKQLRLALSTAGINGWTWEVGSDRLTWLMPHGQKHFVQSCADYYRIIHREDRKRVRELIEHGVPNGHNFEVEYRILVDKQERWVLSKGFVWSEGKRVKKAIGINVDITEHKRMEAENLASERELLQVTVDSLAEGVIATNNAGRVIFINEAAAELTGHAKTEALGKPVEKLLYIIDDRTSEPFTEILPGVSYHNPILVNRDLREIPIFIESSPIKLRNGKQIGTVTIILDISEQRHAERELLKTEKLESLGVLAAGIAHDFNNILTAIISNIQLAAFHFDRDEDIRPSLREIVEIAHRATGLTKQLLTFAKGGAPIKKHATLIGLIKDTTDFVLSGSKIKAHYQMEDRLWTVRVDEGQISQVIHNLVINAKQAMPNGGIIKICAENVEIKPGNKLKPGRYVKLTVNDQGIGISKDIMNKIFAPFFTTKNKGNGLGLATAFSIMHQHDGEIEVESQVGRGSSFKLYLPATELKAAQVDALRETATTRAEGRILFMDDEAGIRRAVGSLLQSYGYEIVLTGEGQETINTFKQAYEAGEPFDAVILDLTIPGGMGGLEVIGHLRRIDPRIKAIVSSGYADDPIMAEYKKYGFAGVASKPYKIDELLEVLHQVI